LMVFHYGLVQSDGQIASAEQNYTVIRIAVEIAERYYPAFQLVV
jgi:hypothetical protein